LRDWPYSEYAHNLSRSESELLKSRFEGELIKALEQLVEKYPNLKIIPFPMCTNHIGNDDRWFYRRLFRNANKIHDSLDLTYLGAEISPVESVNVFKSASIALTMRFHSLVFALSSCVPTVAIDYTLSDLLDKEPCQPHNSRTTQPLKFTNAVTKFIKSLEP
jgi:polysaccharide pyruvyl transferase WcaK-like protein